MFFQVIGIAVLFHLAVVLSAFLANFAGGRKRCSVYQTYGKGGGVVTCEKTNKIISISLISIMFIYTLGIFTYVITVSVKDGLETGQLHIYSSLIHLLFLGTLFIFSHIALILGLFLVSSYSLALYLKITHKTLPQQIRIRLESVIDKMFDVIVNFVVSGELFIKNIFRRFGHKNNKSTRPNFYNYVHLKPASPVHFLIIGLVTIGFMLTPLLVEAAIIEPGFESETVVSGLTLATAMDFAPDGRIFIAEKSGTIKVVKNGVLLAEPLVTLTDVNTFGDRGLLGIAVDPNFSNNGHIYVSYTYENTPGQNVAGAKTGRIARLTVTGDKASESSKVVILGTVGGGPGFNSCEDFLVTDDCIPSDSNSHSVGGLRFGPDGKLYATLGDGADFAAVDYRALRAQNIDSLAGKMLRINTDGTGVIDNPFYNGNPNSNRSKIFALGFRNMYRFNFNKATGKIYGGDVGWSSWEEVNEIRSGANYGWPCREGNVNTEYGCNPSSTPTSPLYTYAHNQAGAGSVTAGAFFSEGAYPESYATSFFVGDYAQMWMKRVVLDGAGNLVSVEDFADMVWPVDISTGKDGNIYYLDIVTGQLMRITHTSGNRRPVVVVGANPASGLAPLTVNFSSLGTYDPDGDSLSYLWSFGDGYTTNSPNPNHTYLNNGSYDAVLTVADNKGASVSKSISILVGNQAPVANILSPVSGSLYQAAEQVTATGSGWDEEDGNLPASAFSWEVILHHNTHTHTIYQTNNTKSITFTADDHQDSDVYLEIKLTVRDSAGISNSRSINMYLDGGGAEGNLVSNPSLEIEGALPGFPLDWYAGWWGTMNPVFSYPVIGLSGDKAARVDVSDYVSGTAKWYFTPAFVSVGQEYNFSNVYRSNVTTYLTAQFTRANGTSFYESLAVLPPAADPTTNNLNITVPPETETMTIFHEIASNGSLTVDEYSLTLFGNDTEPPTGTITSPKNGDAVSGPVTIRVNATDNIGVTKMHLYVDGSKYEGIEDVSSPWELVWDTREVPNGSYELRVHIHDAAENHGLSDPITITVANSLSTPINLVYNGDFEIADGDAPAGWSRGGWGTNVRELNYPVTGYGGGRAAEVKITKYDLGDSGDAKWFFADIPVSPGIEYTFKTRFKSTSISDVIGRYTMSDNSVHYFGLLKEIPESTSWQQITNTFVPPEGAVSVTFFHLISSVATLTIDDVEVYESGSGNPSETNPPLVAFLNPRNNQTVSGNVTLRASSTDDTAVVGVYFAINGVPYGVEDKVAPYETTWDTTQVANGTYILKATSHDPFGNNDKDEITVVVNNGVIEPPSGLNLIKNPALESSTNNEPNNWFKGGWGTNTRTHTYPVPGASGDAAKVAITSYTSGDAKWYFEDVMVNEGERYTFSYSYKSTVGSNLTVRYHMTDDSYLYVRLANLSPSASWKQDSVNFVAPAGTESLTIFNAISGVGELAIDDYSLVSDNSNSFDRGKVSLTFDDGWLEQATVAAPVLDSAGLEGTFYVVSDRVLNPSQGSNLIKNPALESSTNNEPNNWFKGGWGSNTRTHTYPVPGASGDAAKVAITSYTSGDAKWYFEDVAVSPNTEYSFSSQYKSNIPSDMVARYTMDDGSYLYVNVASLPSSNNVWVSHIDSIRTPVGASSVTIFHIIYRVGELSVDEYELRRGVSGLYFNLDDALGIRSQGHEIGSHSKTHIPLTNLSSSQLEREVSVSKTDLELLKLGPIETFSYPFGAYDSTVKAAIGAAGYGLARSTDRGFNDKVADRYSLKIQQVDRSTTVTDVIDWINQAEANNLWLILMFHQISNDTDDVLGITPDDFAEIIDYVSRANVDVITVREGELLLN